MAVTDLANYILSEVVNIVHEEFSGSYPKYGLFEVLLSLEPDKPEDGSRNFIAYNVPGKDRMKIKTGKFLVRKLGLNKGFLNDKQISDLADKIDRYLSPKRKVKLCKGKEITENYKKEIGGHSCMTGNNYFCTKLYEINPERFSQLVMFYGSHSGRAIVHKLDCGMLFMDRIYTDNDALAKDMIEYAAKKGWAYRVSEGKCIRALYGIDTEKLIVSNLNYKDGEVPYMDTLCRFLITEDNKLTIFHPDVGLVWKGELLSTGGYLEEDKCTCNSCGNNVYEDDAYVVNGEYYCEDCFNKYCFACAWCNEYGFYDNAIQIKDTGEFVCQDCAERNYCQCSDCYEWFSELGSHGYCEDCVNNHEFCTSCGEEVDDVDEDGNCEDCAESQDDETDDIIKDTETKYISFVIDDVEKEGKC
jgi:hypothetical protein